MRPLGVGIVQLAWEESESRTLRKACDMTREAASQGARVVCLPELLTTPYFCKDKDPGFFQWAKPLAEHPDVVRLSALAAELGVVLPVSFFERAETPGDASPRFFNSCLVINADGRPFPLYRKSHIPDGPGYEEKYYFAPGDTGFLVHATPFGRVGVGVCWDQWFPEAARAMVLQGADVLLYPTAIGSEPMEPAVDTSGHWQRVMQGHAGANLTPVAAANRVGVETGACCQIAFYGSSFIADQTGAMTAQAGREEECVRVTVFDLDRLRAAKRIWGFFRDRRPDLYASLVATPPPLPPLD